MFKLSAVKALFLFMDYSFIIPIYNRPKELEELLDSLLNLDFKGSFEVLVIDDGSSIDLEKIIDSFSDQLNLRFYRKQNEGPAKARNFGMQRAKAERFIILDSDVLLPATYLEAIDDLDWDVFGGPDSAHSSFNRFQKAVNYSMTSFLTTGNLRGNEGKDYLARSFNLGLTREVFELTKGFSDMRVGEDIDFSLRVKQVGRNIRFIPKAFVYHKRRSNAVSFFKQVYRFGSARPLLNNRFKGSAKFMFWFPTLFLLGFVASLVLAAFEHIGFLLLFIIYFLAILLDSSFKNRSISVGLLSILTSLVQFTAYGLGFLKSQLFR